VIRGAHGEGDDLGVRGEPTVRLLELLVTLGERL
jgi:hypothetical protein